MKKTRKKNENDSLQESNLFYDEQDAINSAPLVDLIMETDYANSPPGVMVPKEVWKKQKRLEITEELSSKRFRNRFSLGLDIIITNLEGHLTKPELKKIGEELFRGVESATAVIKTASDFTSQAKEKEVGPKIESLQEILNISDETIEKIYQCGIQLNQCKSVKEASDVFYVLSVIDFRRHNVWIALGLCEQRLGNFDPALEAYAMAILTDIKDPWPYVYSAECYEILGMKTDAKECLERALEHSDDLPKELARRIETSLK